MSAPIEELVQFLQIGARIDLKLVALEHILGLTANDSGIETITDNSALLVSLISLLDDNSIPIAKDSALALINISANVKGAETLLSLDVDKCCPPLQKPPDNIIKTVLTIIFNPENKLADPSCMILSNLTRPGHLTERVIDKIEESGRSFEEIINVFTKKQFNSTGARLHYLGPVLSNLSQSRKVRKYILDRQKCVVQRLLPFTEYQESLVRRGGVVGTLKNCCFEEEFHEWLLGDEVDILPRLLLPLAGNEEFDEEDNDKLPAELQYLEEDKEREPDPDVRCILLEALTQLCSKRKNREFVRDKNSYVILRELHKWEKDKKALLACENLVDILIRTEDEIGEDNLRQIEVPEHLHEGFTKADEEFLKESS